jgi:hypothetical protein
MHIVAYKLLSVKVLVVFGQLSDLKHSLMASVTFVGTRASRPGPGYKDHVFLGDDPHLIGRLRYDVEGLRESAAFTYDANWLSAPLQLRYIAGRHIQVSSKHGSAHADALAQSANFVRRHRLDFARQIFARWRIVILE